MSALRRDLIERRLWIAVVVLVAIVVAVPFLLHSRAKADTTVIPQAPSPAAANAAAKAATVATVKSQPVAATTPAPGVTAKERHVEFTRDPFSTMPHLTSRPHQKQPVTTSAAASPTTSSTTPTTPAASAASTGPDGGTGAGGGSDGGTSGGVTDTTAGTTGGGSGGAETVTVTTTQTTTAPTKTSTTPVPLGKGPWTIASVDVSVANGSHSTARKDIARLTPLPAAATPEAMYTGTLDHGHVAVFALANNVRVQGHGRCLPNASTCSAIAMAPGDSVTLTYFLSGGNTAQRVLKLTRIARTVTTSPHVAIAAWARVSRAGQCELDLAAPTEYDATTGALSTDTKAVCAHVTDPVPFPGPRANP